MDIRVLKYFLMVAREENITKAASLLHVTQPTLSRQLIQLEEELGVKLFIRGKHRIILTDDGMLLKRRAQEIVSLTDKTIREFTDFQQISEYAVEAMTWALETGVITGTASGVLEPGQAADRVQAAQALLVLSQMAE